LEDEPKEDEECQEIHINLSCVENPEQMIVCWGKEKFSGYGPGLKV